MAQAEVAAEAVVAAMAVTICDYMAVAGFSLKAQPQLQP